MGVSQNGWFFFRENPEKNMDDGTRGLFYETSIYRSSSWDFMLGWALGFGEVVSAKHG